LIDAGVHEFNLYLMTEEKERILDAYGKQIIPKFAGAVAR
jgi:hypothetical protein